MKNISIEWLKAKRTKSFFVSILVMGIGLLWSVAAAIRYISNPDTHEISLIFYMMREVNSLILPIVTSLFISRIVKNEKEGNTFKLLLSNGEKMRHLFWGKLYLTMMMMFFLSLLEGSIVIALAVFVNLAMPIRLVVLQILDVFLASFVLVCLFLCLQFLIQKQALILALGIFGGFLGMLSSHAPSIVQFVFPFGGTGYLSLVEYQKLGEQVKYVLLDKAGLKCLLYLLVCVSYLLTSLYFVEKKGAKL